MWSKKQDGFTLIEVMVATAILTVGLTGILVCLGEAVHTLSLVRGYEEATLEAENRLAELITDHPRIPFERKGIIKGRGNFLWQAMGKRAGDSEGLIILKVSVTFPFRGGDRSVSVQTAEAERDLPKQRGRGT